MNWLKRLFWKPTHYWYSFETRGIKVKVLSKNVLKISNAPIETVILFENSIGDKYICSANFFNEKISSGKPRFTLIK